MTSARSVAVVGGGAAGLVAAIFAASGGADVLLIERTTDGGRKILISGGGRCNILPSVLAPERFVTDSPGHLMRGMLRAWPLNRQHEFFEREVGVPLALEATSGKVFPRSNRARDVRDGLVALARQRGVRLQFDTSVTGIDPADGGWILRTTRGDIPADRVILATGGLSVPATGSDGTGLRIAAGLGHREIATYPALTPLVGGSPVAVPSSVVARSSAVASPPPPHSSLAGVSLNVRLRARAAGRSIETSGGFLFTHRGYSGPAVLDISHVATRRRMGSRPAGSTLDRARVDPGRAAGSWESAGAVPSWESGLPPSSESASAASTPSHAVVRVQWSPLDASMWIREFAATSGAVATLLNRHLPARLADQLLAEAGVPPDRRLSDLRRAERTALVDHLTSYVLPWVGDEGYKKAEVTGGGVALDEVDPRTMESRRSPGLFLCGEMLDAFGPIGGHNFAWAWATGRAAGLAAGT